MTVVVAAAVLTAAVAGMAPRARGAPEAPLAWSPQPTPVPRLTSTSVLSSVSCPSSRMCIAVGYAVNAAGTPAPLLERWDGSRWAIQAGAAPRPARSSFLFGVSCATARSCTAVGSVTRPSAGTGPFAERLAGGRWSIERVPLPRRRSRDEVDYLGAVSCPSTSECTAVGYAGNRQGTAGRALTERWTRGRGWTVQTARAPARAAAAFLSGVSCSSPLRCTAVGFSTGHSGAGAALAETWTPAGWAIARIPTPAGAGVIQLTGVACPSQMFCTAVGSFQVADIEVLLTERWNGARWVIGRPRYPAGARGAHLSDVTCLSPSSCVAAGGLTDTAGIEEPLAERWTPRGWAIQSAPGLDTPAGPVDASLAGVSCASPARCLAVGSATPLHGGAEGPLSLSWGT